MAEYIQDNGKNILSVIKRSLLNILCQMHKVIIYVNPGVRPSLVYVSRCSHQVYIRNYTWQTYVPVTAAVNHFNVRPAFPGEFID